MREIRADYEFPVEGRAWTRGTLPEAGVFFLEGDCHVVARSGPAAEELERRGALLVALVRFDGGSDEHAAPSHAVRAIALDEAVARFADAGAMDGERRPGGRYRAGLTLPPGGRHADEP